MLPSAPVVIMGVSGAGKSSIGRALATALGRVFLDADDLHPVANKAKMAAGIPLDDEDRMPWLDIVARAGREAGAPVIACSALRRRYRDRLLATMPDAVFVELDVSRPELERRLRTRAHEFMSPTLLGSQLATLEPLADDEPGWRLPADAPPAEVVAAAVERLSTAA